MTILAVFGNPTKLRHIAKNKNVSCKRRFYFIQKAGLNNSIRAISEKAGNDITVLELGRE